VVNTATEELLSPQEAGDRLGVSVYTVRRWIKEGKLRAFRPGKEYRVRVADLEEFFRTREVHPKAPSRTSPEALEEVSEEERLSLLDGWRESILAVVDKLGKEFEAVQESGDREDLLTLYSLVAFSRLGASESLEDEEVMQEREGASDEEYRARDRTLRALLRLDDLAEDIEEAVEDDPEEKPAAIVRLADHKRRRAG